MQLGQFSVSLTVKDIKASRAFYEKLGFSRLDGDGEGWLIMTHEGTSAVIGLFQGMFDKNLLTFNPKDVRSIQKHLKEQGVTLIREVDDINADTPDHITLEDPDGNPILFDQHPEDYTPEPE